MATKTKTNAVSQVIFSNPTKSAVQAIREDKLVEMLKANKGATVITIVARTDPKMRKTGNPFGSGEVFKVARVNGMIGWNYANSINNQRDREGNTADLVAQPRRWGVRIPGTPLIEHKGNYYLEMKVERVLDHRFEDSNGNELDETTSDMVRTYLPVRKQAATQQTEKPIILCDYRLSSILSITYKGVCYLVAH